MSENAIFNGLDLSYFGILLLTNKSEIKPRLSQDDINV